MDIASRRIVYYVVSQHDYTATEATSILYKALKQENSVIPHRPVKFVHTDSAAIFLSKEWMQCLEVNEILPSSSNSKIHQNQVSERFNRTFKKLLRDKLNRILNKTDNKTNTIQLIGKATKYNFENLKQLTEDIITYYNSEKPHYHLNELPPDTWANHARLIPEHTYIIKDKPQDNNHNVLDLEPEDHQSYLLKLPKEKLIDHINKVQTSEEISHYANIKDQDSNFIFKNMLELQNKQIIPFVPLAKNDNSEEAKIIRKYKNNIGSLELISHINENKIHFDDLDQNTQKIYQDLSKDVDLWKNTDVKHLETIML